MSNLDQSEASYIKRSAQNAVENARIGRVAQVFEHVENDDYSNFEVDVVILGDDIQHRSIPYQQPANGEIIVPSVGDKVVVEYREGESALPIARNVIYTNEDRPPVGKAGMWRKRIESGDSPAGSGDLYLESYTDYDIDQSITDPDDGIVEESWVRIAKKANDNDTSDLPVDIELYDSPSTDEAHVTIELNKVNGADSTPSWGIKFNLKTGEMKLLDSQGYGIVSDGAGNFTWHYESLNESVGTTDSL